LRLLPLQWQDAEKLGGTAYFAARDHAL
jgi:hypothetical protein